VALRPDSGHHEGDGLQAREQERGRSPCGHEEQAGHHLRLHVQCSRARGVRRRGGRGAETGLGSESPLLGDRWV